MQKAYNEHKRITTYAIIINANLKVRTPVR